jgi:hypothetical protein
MRVVRVGVAAAAVAGLVAAVLAFANNRLATHGAPPCPAQQTGDIRAGDSPSWRVSTKPTDKLLLVLDHQVNDARHDVASVELMPLNAGKSTGPGELPVGAPVGARLVATPRAAEPLAFDVVTSAEVSDDGRSIRVAACTVRPNRDTKPGRYVAPVRVGGTGIVPGELPVEVTVRAGIVSTFVVTLLAAILGVALTHYGTPVQTTLTGVSHTAVVTLAVVVGLIGGVAAAALAYDADPTWGAERAKDTVGLFIATVAGASAAMSAAGAGAKAFDALRPKPGA